MNLPLNNIRVIDLSRMLPGPYCSMILADLGAEVIHVSDPRNKHGDIPFCYEKGKRKINAFNTIIMRNKKSITLNLKKEKGKEIFYKLIEKSDVVLESYRPEITNKLRIDYNNLSKINKRLVYCSLTGYGQTGPYHQLAGHNLNYVGLCGILDLNKERKINGLNHQARKPVLPGSHTAATGGALFAVIGILSSIIEREKNPKKQGQYIDISMLDSAFSLIPITAAFHFSKSKNDPLHGSAPYYQIYQTKDRKFLTVAAFEPKFWYQLCEGLKREDLKSKQNIQGIEKESVFKEIQKEFLTKTQEEWIEIFKNLDTCITPVNNFKNACKDPQIQSREMIINQKHPIIGDIKNINSPIRLSRTPLTIRNLTPKKGEHTEEILFDLGFSKKAIEEFRNNNII